MASEAGTVPAASGGRALLRARFPAVLLSTFAALAVCFPLTNTDIWWHLLTGRTILESGIPFNDPFTVHAQGQAWVDLHWGFQLGAFGLYSLGGPVALVVAKCLIFATGAWLLLKAVEAGHGPSIRPLAVLVLVLLIAAGRSYVFARPIVLSLLFLSAFLFLLERFVASGDWRWLIGLPVTQVLWVNVQPLHILGPVVLGCYLVGEGLALALSRKTAPGFASRASSGQIGLLATCLVAVLLAGLANPFMLDAYRLPLGLLTRIDPTGLDPYAWQVSENIPAWQLARLGDLTSRSLTWIAITTFTSFLLDWRRISLTRLGLAGAFFVLALMANRNSLLFFWVAGPVIAMNCASALGIHWARHPKGLSARWLGSSVPALVAALSLGAGFAGSIFASDLTRPTPFRLPEGSARVLQESGHGGPVFCSVRYGGFLAWRLAPAFRPYIDGRLVLTTPASFAEYLAAVDQPEGFDRLHAKHDFTAAVLPVTLPDRYRTLIRHLLAHPDWCLTYTDGTEALFVPRTRSGFEEVALDRTAQVERIVADQEARLRTGSQERRQARIHLALLLALGGQHDLADGLLDGLAGTEAQAVRARNLFLAGQLEEAERVSKKLLQSEAGHPGSLNVLARIAAQRGESLRAVELASRSLKADPYNLEARRILEAIASPWTGRPVSPGGLDE